MVFKDGEQWRSFIETENIVGNTANSQLANL